MLSIKLILIIVCLCWISANSFSLNGFRRFGVSSTSSKSLRATTIEMNSVKTIPTDPTGVPVPGKPVIREVDNEKNVAKMMVAVPGDSTSKAFQKSCDLYNKEVKERGYTVAGFRPGARLPANYLYQMFGESNVKQLCGSLLAEEIQDEVEYTGLMFVGRGRITNFFDDNFKAGEQHVIEIECDLWPEISYTGSNGYKGLSVSVVKGDFDLEKYESVKQNIRERYKITTVTPQGYTAVMGDVVKANMRGFELDDNGNKGTALPSVASGDGVEIPLETGKFMTGMIEGLVGCSSGTIRDIEVEFPRRDQGPGVALSGKKAIFEVEVIEVLTKEIPEWNEALAARIRDNMTLEELEGEVKQAVEGDGDNSVDNSRNDALAAALLEIAQVSKVSEALMEENTQQRFQEMLMDFKQQGSTQEQLAEMMTPEKYQKYSEISRPNVEKVVKLGMVFRDIAEKENLDITEEEIEDQMSMLKAQAKQRGEEAPDAAAAKDEIENVLLRRKVFDFLASNAEIEWVDAPTESDAPAVPPS